MIKSSTTRLQVIAVATVLVIAMLATKTSKVFPPLQKGHLYRVTMVNNKSDADTKTFMGQVQVALEGYNCVWKGWTKIDATHVQYSFVSGVDEPAPTNLPPEALNMTVEDLGSAEVLTVL